MNYMFYIVVGVFLLSFNTTQTKVDRTLRFISTFSYEFDIAGIETEDYTNLSTECTGIDFNLTSSLNESATYYPGSELDLILYMKNRRNQNITNTKVSIFQGNSLVNQETYDKLFRLEKKNIFITYHCSEQVRRHRKRFH